MKKKILVWTKYPGDTAFYIYDALKKDHHLMVRCDMLGNIHTTYVHVICTHEPSRIKGHAPFDAVFDCVLDCCTELSKYSLFISDGVSTKSKRSYQFQTVKEN